MKRYTILKSINVNKWLDGCPVSIEKYNILCDNLNNVNILQIKFKNISSVTIKSLWIKIFGYDDSMDKTEILNDITYLEINAAPKADFGGNTPISLKSVTTRNIKIIIEKVVYTNNDVWRNDKLSEGIEVPVANPKDIYGNLYNQYVTEAKKLKLSYVYAFVEKEDYWICSCGQANKNGINKCCRCSADYYNLCRISKNDYLEQKKSKHKKNIQILISTIAIILIGVFLLVNIPKFIKYKSAEKFVSNNEFDKAIESYSELGDFLSSEDKLNEAQYLKAQFYYYNGLKEKNIDDLKHAAHIYSDIQNYSNSNQKLIETYYNLAVIEYNNGDYESALIHYRLCGNYGNSEDMTTSSQNQITLKGAAEAYNKGDYTTAARMYTDLGGYANSNEMAESSKMHLYQEMISGKMEYTAMINRLELLADYNYKDCKTRLTNIRYKFRAISGHYGTSRDYMEFSVKADYKTNKLDIVISPHLERVGINAFNDPIRLNDRVLLPGDAGAYGYSSFITFYDGYIVYEDTRYEKTR